MPGGEEEASYFLGVSEGVDEFWVGLKVLSRAVCLLSLNVTFREPIKKGYFLFQ